MSKVKITGNASGTGTLTISAPNTNTDRTLTLPDGAGEILLSDGDGSQLTNLPAGGKVLQVVQSLNTSGSNHTSTSYTASSLGVSITPSSTSSKIYVMFSGGMNGHAGTHTTSQKAMLKIYRRIAGGSYAELESNSSGQQVFYSPGSVYEAISINYLHSPNTTSQVDYLIYAAQGGGNDTTFSINRDSNNQTQAIAMEIGA